MIKYIFGIELNTIYPANGFKYMCMKKSEHSTHTKYSNNIFELILFRIK